MKRLALAVVAALALSACGSTPEVGRVTGKHYDEAYTSYVPMCMAYGKTGCTVWVPMPFTSGPFWVLDLTDGAEKWSVLTTPQRYEKTLVGDTVKVAEVEK